MRDCEFLRLRWFRLRKRNLLQNQMERAAAVVEHPLLRF